jgi:hypothetical protein
MPGVAWDYSILHHPFMIILEGIVFLVYGRQGGAENRVFESSIGRPGHLQPGGFGLTLLVSAAGGPLQADAAILPKLVLSLEPPGRVQVCKDSHGTYGADTRKLLPEADDRVFPAEAYHVLLCHPGLFGRGVVSDPEHEQLFGKRRLFQLDQPVGPVLRLAQNLPGYLYAMHPTARPDLVHVSDSVMHAVMVQADPVLELDSPVIIAMVNFPQIAAFEEQCELGRIYLVVVIAIGTYELVAPRVGYNEAVNLLTQITVEPAGHRTFLDGHVSGAFQRTENLNRRVYAGWY